MTIVIVSAILLCLFAIWVDDQNINLYRYPLVFAQVVPKIKIGFEKGYKKYSFVMSYVKPDKTITEAMQKVPYFAGISAFRSAYKSTVKDHNRIEATETIEKYIEASAFGYCYVGNYCDQININADKPEKLHEMRNLLRSLFDYWSDSIYSTSMNYNDTKLAVTYVGKNKFRGFSIQIKIEYPLDELPKGLLKEGCKIVEETETTTTRSIVCEL